MTRTMGLNMWWEPRCGGCGPLAGGVPLLEPELLEDPDDFGVGGRGLEMQNAFDHLMILF